MKPNNFCCERFKKEYEDGPIQYAYEDTNETDETDWYVESFTHLYYCPYCGAFIKCQGFGDYDKKYPPKPEVKVIKQE